MIEQAGDIEEGIDGDAGSIAQWEARGGLFGHPGRDGQAAFGELDAERSPRLLIDEHRSKPLAHEGVIRVQDRDDLVTGIVSVASFGGLSHEATARRRPSKRSGGPGSELGGEEGDGSQGQKKRDLTAGPEMGFGGWGVDRASPCPGVGHRRGAAEVRPCSTRP